MGRGRPKKKAVMTPLARTRVFSSPSGMETSSITMKGKSPTPTLEATVEEVIVEEPHVNEKPEATNKPAGTPQLWVDVIKGNRLPSNGRGIDYTPLEVVNGGVEVKLEEQDLVS